MKFFFIYTHTNTKTNNQTPMVYCSLLMISEFDYQAIRPRMRLKMKIDALTVLHANDTFRDLDVGNFTTENLLIILSSFCLVTLVQTTYPLR